MKIPNLGGRQAEKKRKIFAAGRGGGRMARAEGGGAAAAVLAGWLVRRKSKINCALLSIVLFYVLSNLFCTVYTFAPWPGMSGMPEAGRRMGCQAGRLAGLYPPLMLYSWDDKGF